MLALQELTDNGDADLAPDVLAAANINPTTRLATDYLNHFNNVVMLLEFVATMPDFVEEILAWKPLDYVSYFATSHFRQRDLAIAAYRAADGCTRKRFDAIIADLDVAVMTVQDFLRNSDPADPSVSTYVRGVVREHLQPLISEAGGIINGPCIVEETDEITGGSAQASIDELFL